MKLGFLSSTTRQTVYLWAVDGASNAFDYAFHLLVGRALAPAGFAIVQTVNSSLLIFVTAVAVSQPVVARLIAGLESSGHTTEFSGTAVRFFRRIVGQAFWVGLALTALVFSGAGYLERWLNLPAAVIRIAAPVLLLALLKPIAAGMLQGAERFRAYSFLRLSQAAGRLAFGAALLAVGGGLLGAMTAFPLGYLAALTTGAVMLGRSVWSRPFGDGEIAGFNMAQLAFSALVAYAAYMSLLNTDMIWINRGFDPALAGDYATTVLLRRVLLLVPGAAVVVMFPRVVSAVERGGLPDKEIAETFLLVGLPTALLTLLYFGLGEQVVALTFGKRYLGAAPYLGWMGLSVIGYAFASVWMNVFLATRPLPYVIFLGLAAITQNLFYLQVGSSVPAFIQIFGLTGWLLVAAGGVLYFSWLRPRLKHSPGLAT